MLRSRNDSIAGRLWQLQVMHVPVVVAALWGRRPGRRPGPPLCVAGGGLPGGTTEIDARKSGGMGRFVNDYRGQATKPNCIFEKMQDVHGQPFVRIVTTRRVEPGEQLFVDYGKPFWVGHGSSMLSRDDLMQMESEELSTSLVGKKTC